MNLELDQINISFQSDKLNFNQDLDFWRFNEFKIPSENEQKFIAEFQNFPLIAHKNVQEKWNEIGSFKIKDFIAQNKLSFNESLTIQRDTYENGLYFGQIDQNRKGHGIGRFIKKNGNMYEGSFVNGVREGFGREIYISKQYYIGEWKNDKRNGFGTYYYRNGEIKKGIWEDNNLVAE